MLNTATKGIAEVISQHLLVNIDLNDARKVLENSGTAVMGQSEATGENRAIEAVLGALDSPLLNDNDISGAEQVLLKIVTGGGDDEIKMSELNKIKNKIQEAAGNDVNIIEGIGIDSALGAGGSVTVIATGFEQKIERGPVKIDLEANKKLEDVYEDSSINESSLSNNQDSSEVNGQQQFFDLEDDIKELENTDTISNQSSSIDIEPNLQEEQKVVMELDDDIENQEEQKVVMELDDDIENQEEQEIVMELDDDIENQEEPDLPDDLIPSVQEEESVVTETEEVLDLDNEVADIDKEEKLNS